MRREPPRDREAHGNMARGWELLQCGTPHCDRDVASSARRAAWRVVWVPQEKVYCHTPVYFSEVRAEWRPTRLAVACSLNA